MLSPPLLLSISCGAVPEAPWPPLFLLLGVPRARPPLLLGCDRVGGGLGTICPPLYPPPPTLEPPGRVGGTVPRGNPPIPLWGAGAAGAGVPALTVCPPQSQLSPGPGGAYREGLGKLELQYAKLLVRLGRGQELGGGANVGLGGPGGMVGGGEEGRGCGGCEEEDGGAVGMRMGGI